MGIMVEDQQAASKDIATVGQHVLTIALNDIQCKTSIWSATVMYIILYVATAFSVCGSSSRHSSS